MDHKVCNSRHLTEILYFLNRFRVHDLDVDFVLGFLFK